MAPTLSVLLASLIYHYDFLIDNLPPKHPLLSTVIFTDLALKTILSERLLSGLTSPRMLATGIPPHVELLRQMQCNEQSILAVPELVLSGVREIVDENGLMAGHITRSYFETTLESTVTKTVELALVVANTTTTTANRCDSTAACYNDVLVYHWGGGLHKLPETFEFPSVDVSTAWTLWWLGNPSQKLPPYRTIQTRDLSSSNQRKAFYEWRYIMDKMTQFYANTTGNELGKSSSAIDLVRSFEIAQGVLEPVRGSTSRKRKRRDGQLRVATAARLLRQSSATPLGQEA